MANGLLLLLARLVGGLRGRVLRLLLRGWRCDGLLLSGSIWHIAHSNSFYEYPKNISQVHFEAGY